MFNDRDWVRHRIKCNKPMLAYYRHRLIFYGILTELAGEWGVL